MTTNDIMYTIIKKCSQIIYTFVIMYQNKLKCINKYSLFIIIWIKKEKISTNDSFILQKQE